MSNDDIQELRTLDKVRLVNIPPPDDYLNGKEAYVRPAREENDGTGDPGLAKLPDGRYSVVLASEHDQPNKDEYYKVKRKNLILVEAGEVSKAINGVTTATSANIRSVEDFEREYPGLEGWYPAILQGDTWRVKEILEYIQSSGFNAPLPPGDAMIDQSGDTALLGAIQRGHGAIVDLLISFGADVNRKWASLNPLGSSLAMRYLHVSISVLGVEGKKDTEKEKERQDIVIKLIESGADVSVPSNKGTPLELILDSALLKVPWQYRLKVVKLLLEKGASPTVLMFANHAHSMHWQVLVT